VPGHGTAAVFAKKGEQVWTGANDAEWLSRGVYECFTKENLRYSQVAPLDMWNEVNTGTNLPAQIDIHATPGAAYEFLFVAKGGGSANKMLFFQETKALLNPRASKVRGGQAPLLGTAACPPYHLVFVVGGTSAEACMKTLKLASARYLDSLPTTGNELGRAFRDTEWEAKVLEIARKTGIGAQFGGKYFASTCASSGCPATARAAPSAWACRAAPTATSRQDHPGRDLPREARDQPGPLHPAGAAHAQGHGAS
jgi:fumarate hydratase, class I